jgi:hypothetical protein
MSRARSARFSRWLRANSERYLLESAQTEMARRYLGRPGPAGERGLVPGLWRHVFVPVYRRLPWGLRQSLMHAMPGSHRQVWRQRAPRPRTPGITFPITASSDSN